ncbi:MAG: GtrA family protein [Clostridiales bacterium]|nr:GtrA family protein [Clostridiales bacterium]
MKNIRELYRKYKEIIHYLIAGVLTTVVSLSVYYACVLTVLDPQNALQLQAANVISWVVAVTFAYFINRIFVFESKSEQIGREMLSFYASRALTLLLDMGFMFLLVTLMGMSDKIGKLVVQVLVTVGNYIFSKLFVFKWN